MDARWSRAGPDATAEPVGGRLALWVAGLVVLTGIGVVLVRASGIDPETGTSPAIVLIAFSSSLAALIATAVIDGRRGIRSLLGSVLVCRFAARWYLVAILGPAVLVAAAHAVYGAGGGHASWPSSLDVGALASGSGAIVAGCLGEEFGWRGLAQPMLQRRFSAFTAAVIVGLIWATWHLWPVLVPASGASSTGDVVQTYVRLVATAIGYAWLYQSTGGSLLVVMLAHAAHNIAVDLLPLNATEALILALLDLLGAAVVVALAGRRSLVRDQARGRR